MNYSASTSSVSHQYEIFSIEKNSVIYLLYNNIKFTKKHVSY